MTVTDDIISDPNNHEGSNRASSGSCGFLKQVFRGPWFMVFSSFLIMATSGTNYIFGVYSSTLKSTLGYDQADLNMISTFKDWGSVFGIPTGLLSEVAPNWIVLLIGAILNFLGYFLVYLAVLKKIARPKTWLMCAYLFIGANSSNYLNTGSYMICVKNFPQSRGLMIGLMKGMLGLSGALFTQIYNAIWDGNDPTGMILLIAILPAVVTLVFLFTIRLLETPSMNPREKKFYYGFFGIAVFLGLFLLLITLLQTYIHFTPKKYIISCAIVLVITFSPIYLVLKEEWYTWTRRNRPQERASSSSSSPVPTAAAAAAVEEEDISIADPCNFPETGAVEAEAAMETGEVEAAMETGEVKELDTKTAITTVAPPPPENNWTCMNKPPRGSDFGIMQALISIDMMLLFIITFCGFGCCQATINNFGQIGQSLNYSNSSVSVFVALISIWNFFGRVLGGFLSDYLLKKWKIPRPILLAFSLMVSALGDLLIALDAFPGAIYLASLLTGLSYGSQLTMIFVLVSEFFGLLHFPMLANCANIVSPFGLYVFNVQVVGRLYDIEALKQFRELHGPYAVPSEDLICMGKQCFYHSSLILTGSNMVGCFMSLVLYLRTRKFYHNRAN